MTTVKEILERNDPPRKEDVATIADHMELSIGYVYAVLREHRPNRKRKTRTPTSDKPAMIAALATREKWKPSRIAKVLGISRQYVYRHMP